MDKYSLGILEYGSIETERADQSGDAEETTGEASPAGDASHPKG